jgi:hypothetical protein
MIPDEQIGSSGNASKLHSEVPISKLGLDTEFFREFPRPSNQIPK